IVPTAGRISNRSGLDPDGTSCPIMAVLRLDNGYLEHASRMRFIQTPLLRRWESHGIFSR
ncbi:hypothetical protein N9I05_06280, partial [Pseudomonadales bacterium]|nr:hypothetical protein [Pseudomonadales bacterium]